MKNINWKTVVSPIVATGVLEYSLLTNKAVSQALQNEITVVAVAVVTGFVSLYGYFKNHKKG